MHPWFMYSPYSTHLTFSSSVFAVYEQPGLLGMYSTWEQSYSYTCVLSTIDIDGFVTVLICGQVVKIKRLLTHA